MLEIRYVVEDEEEAQRLMRMLFDAGQRPTVEELADKEPDEPDDDEVKTDTPEKPKRRRRTKAELAADGGTLEEANPVEVTDISDDTPDEQSAASLEEVRAALADLSRKGKSAEVKGLIEGYGVSKLTDIPEEHYADLLAQARGLTQ